MSNLIGTLRIKGEEGQALASDRFEEVFNAMLEEDGFLQDDNEVHDYRILSFYFDKDEDGEALNEFSAEFPALQFTIFYEYEEYSEGKWVLYFCNGKFELHEVSELYPECFIEGWRYNDTPSNEAAVLHFVLPVSSSSSFTTSGKNFLILSLNEASMEGARDASVFAKSNRLIDEIKLSASASVSVFAVEDEDLNGVQLSEMSFSQIKELPFFCGDDGRMNGKLFCSKDGFKVHLGSDGSDVSKVFNLDEYFDDDFTEDRTIFIE